MLGLGLVDFWVEVKLGAFKKLALNQTLNPNP